MKTKLELTLSKDPSAISAFLKANNLPVLDLAEENVRIYNMHIHEEIVATIGLEKYGNNALLRSLAVKEEFRNQHLADKMITGFFELCRSEGITDVYLLTTTAEGYFKRKGFIPIERKQVPGSIRKTREFSSICPSSAVVMHREVTPD